MDRRTLLQAALAAGLWPLSNISAASSHPGKVYFGYGKTGIGSALGSGLAELLHEFYPGFEYELLHDTGRNTIEAIERVRGAGPADDWLLQTQSVQTSIFPALYSNLSYDPINDFEPITALGQACLSLTVGPLVDPGVQTLDDYVDWVRRNPEYRHFGCTQYGSHGHLAGLMIARDKNVAIRAEPYAGTSMVIQDILDGVLAAGLVITGNSPQAYRNGQLRSLGVTSATRYVPWASVPTLTEQGVSGIDIRIWYAWLAPLSMSKNRVQRLVSACREAKQISEFQIIQQSIDLETLDMTPEEIRARIRHEIEFYRGLFNEFRLSPLS